MARQETLFAGAALGVGILLAIKYVIVGLRNWNATFHPDRQDNPSGLFYCPLLRLAGGCVEQVSHQITY